MQRSLTRRRLLAAVPVLAAGLVAGFPMNVRRARADAGAVNVYSARHYPSDQTLFDMFTDDEVKQALEDLPENFRLPVLLADVEDFSYKEIAEILDIPIGTVMSRLHRGRKAMQKRLTDFATERGLLARTPTGGDDPVPDPEATIHG